MGELIEGFKRFGAALHRCDRAARSSSLRRAHALSRGRTCRLESLEGRILLTYAGTHIELSRPQPESTWL